MGSCKCAKNSILFLDINKYFIIFKVLKVRLVVKIKALLIMFFENLLMQKIFGQKPTGRFVNGFGTPTIRRLCV